MKVGDKVVCIKELPKGSLRVTTKDKIYSVNYIMNKNNVFITTDIENEYIVLQIKEGPYARLYKDFNDYFITLKEYRKNKLEKINGRTT